MKPENNSVATFHSLCHRIERDFKGLRGIAIGNSTCGVPFGSFNKSLPVSLVPRRYRFHERLTRYRY